MVSFLQAQKRIIDTSVCQNWPVLNLNLISADGDIVTTCIRSDTSYLWNIQSMNIGWSKTFNTAIPIGFSVQSKSAVLTSKDTIIILSTKSDDVEKITNVADFQFSAHNKERLGWIAYRLKGKDQSLLVRNINAGKVQSFDNILNYQFNELETALLMQKKASNEQIEMLWLDLKTGSVKTIWSGIVKGQAVFSPNGDNMAIICKSGKNSNAGQILVYNKGDVKATTIDLNEKQSKGITVNSIKYVDDNSRQIYLNIEDTTLRAVKHNPLLSSVDIYSYRDARLQSQQLMDRNRPVFTYVYNIGIEKLIQLNYPNQWVASALGKNNVVLFKNAGGDYNEFWWNKKSQTDVYLKSTISGSETLLKSNVPINLSSLFTVSPTGKYVIYFDDYINNYISYNTITGERKNITKKVKVDWTNGNDEPLKYHLGVAGWASDESTVWLRSRYDLIQSDPEGKIKAFNLTQGVGNKKHLSFKIIPGNYTGKSNSAILLSYVNENNKDEGFCSVRPGVFPTLTWLANGSYQISKVDKASDANIYYVTRETARSKNIFVTEDFKSFTPISNFHPEKEFNWWTSELINYKTNTGKATQAVLYKPENFDPKKKYPIIFHYYERTSDRLHTFPHPTYEDGNELDFVSYVSNGYLVCLVDIQYQMGYPGRSACESVTGAANYLSRFSWVDKNRMGLMGHSFGGFETNYIITHSHLFAAAASFSSLTDFVSAYGSLILGRGYSRQKQFEIYRDRIGASLWERPDLYMENSPVLQADKVTTPVLLMANKKDEDVTYAQGFEFYTALRRLQKKAWLLQYDNGYHALDDITDKRDLTARTRQFFDHYLKGMPPPKWMTEGIPALRKQIDYGLNIDSSGKQP